MNLDTITHVNDVALLGLVKRLKTYSRQIDDLIISDKVTARETSLEMTEMRDDLDTAAGLIDHIARTRDDYK